MIVYISMVAWILVIHCICPKWQYTNQRTGKIRFEASYTQAFLTAAFIIFFIGLRSDGADTSAYIKLFRELPVGFGNMVSAVKSGMDEVGFEIFGIFVKTYISQDFHVYLFIIAAISGCAVFLTLRKYSEYFTSSMVLFMLSGTFTWMINGIRQFLAVSLAFAAVKLILEKKTVLYIILVCLLSTVHTSALILIPVYFIVQGEAWNQKTVWTLIASMLVLVFTSQFTNILDSVLVGTTYEGAVEQFATDDGANPIRVLINAVPAVIAFLNRRQVKEKAPRIIHICINMSIVGCGVSLISVVTSGILIGRLPIYFTIYNLILLPWLVQKTFHGETRKILYLIMMGLYAVYFYYQNFVVNYYYYASDILHMYFFK